MDLRTDPIIIFYENMLKKTQADLEPPEYSEVYLRLAVRVLLGEEHIILPELLQLYRKLLVFHYCAKYPSIDVVNSIMERIFTRIDIYKIIADENVLTEQWEAFRKLEMCPTVFIQSSTTCTMLNMAHASNSNLMH